MPMHLVPVKSQKDRREFLDDFIPVDHETVKRGLDEARHIMVERFNLFGYYKGKPIVFYINFPDINQAVRTLSAALILFESD